MKEPWSLRGKRALVTGATRGIGRATAEGLLDFGAEVLVVGLDEERAAATGAAWRREGRPGFAVAADVTTPEGRAAVVAAVGARWPCLDVLVNNVGAGNRKAFVDVTDEDFGALVSLNFASAALLTRDLHPFLKLAEGASVVNVGAVAGLVSVPNTTAYAALKGALLQLTRGLAVEWAPDRIRVNAVSPWFTRTPRIEAILTQPEVVDRIVSRTPLGRVAEAEEVASVIVFLCLGASSYVTGQNVIVDGGATLAGIL
jgi:NAD(P)-dependent dehydrogenase (short-subunit alcohol dehydrogenase family)